MQDDLKEALAKINQLNATILHIGANTAEMANQYRARIAALEADNARLMGLVKEAMTALDKCGEPNRYHAPCLTCGPKTVEKGCYIARATFAKIKEATDAE